MVLASGSSMTLELAAELRGGRIVDMNRPEL